MIDKKILCALFNDLPLAENMPGDVMDDGSIYAGLVDERWPVFAMPADAGGLMTLDQAQEYAEKLNHDKVLGHDDWRVPTVDELELLFHSRQRGALKGTFNCSAGDIGTYWSSSPYRCAFMRQNFNSGRQDHMYGMVPFSVRCVRGS